MISRRIVRNLQLVGAQEHDRIPTVTDILAVVGEVFAIGSIGTNGADGTLSEQGFGKHRLIADDDRPCSVAFHPGPPVGTGLDIEVDVDHRLLVLELLLSLIATGRLALAICFRGFVGVVTSLNPCCCVSNSANTSDSGRREVQPMIY